MANGNGNGNGVWMRWTAMAMLAILLAWLGVITRSSATHVTEPQLTAVESRSVAADLSIKAAIAGSEERMTRRLERIEDLVTHPPVRER